MGYEVHNTSDTLIQRACARDDDEVWEEFVGYYKNFIFILLCYMNIPRQECDDITQKVLVKVWKSLPKFDKERAKFRTWLIIIIRSVAARHMSKLTTLKKRSQEQDVLADTLLNEQTDELEKLYQKEWENYITSLAMKNIEQFFTGNALEVFNLFLDNCPPKEIADKLGMHLHSVYNLKNRVKGRLIAEIKRLRTELEL